MPGKEIVECGGMGAIGTEGRNQKMLKGEIERFGVRVGWKEPGGGAGHTVTCHR